MPELRVDRQGRVEIWTLDRDEARNALSRALASELLAHVRRVADDRSLTSVVVTGAGDRAFCAGADLRERRSMSDDDVRDFLDLLHGLFGGIESSERIFIAALNGVALGGGTELALACDLRVAEPSARLGLTEVTLGIIPGAGGTQRLARLIGPGRAKDLILTGRQIAADEAFALGLIHRVAQGRSARDEALLLAHLIARNAPIGVAAAKRAIDRGIGVSLAEGLEIERSEYERTLSTKDRLEGLAAFAQKRPPSFMGE